LTNQEFKEKVFPLFPSAVFTGTTAVANLDGVTYNIGYKRNQYSVYCGIGNPVVADTLAQALAGAISEIKKIQSISNMACSVLDHAHKSLLLSPEAFREQVLTAFPNAKPDWNYLATLSFSDFNISITYDLYYSRWSIHLSDVTALAKSNTLEGAIAKFSKALSDRHSKFKVLSTEFNELLVKGAK